MRPDVSFRSKASREEGRVTHMKRESHAMGVFLEDGQLQLQLQQFQDT